MILCKRIVITINQGWSPLKFKKSKTEGGTREGQKSGILRKAEAAEDKKHYIKAAFLTSFDSPDSLLSAKYFNSVGYMFIFLLLQGIQYFLDFLLSKNSLFTDANFQFIPLLVILFWSTLAISILPVCCKKSKKSSKTNKLANGNSEKVVESIRY